MDNMKIPKKVKIEIIVDMVSAEKTPDTPKEIKF